jgi:SAM-dependent methyltransferase
MVPSPKRLRIPTLKIYDLDSFQKDPKEYWEDGMNPVYFSNPNQFLGRMLNSPLFPFLEKNIPQAGLILDGGSGINYWGKIFDNRQRRIVGLDFAVNNLVQGKDFYPQGLAVGGDLNQLPFASESFEGVISVSAAEHIELGPMKLFAETHRVLKPGGIFILIIPTYNLEDILTFRLLWPFMKKNGGLAPIPHFSGPKYFKKVSELRREGRQGFFAYWMGTGSIRKLLEKQRFTVHNTEKMDILGGMSRSRIFGRWAKKTALQFPISTRRLPAENLTWKERFFFHEDVSRDWYSKWLFHGIGFCYHYLIGFVCKK